MPSLWLARGVSLCSPGKGHEGYQEINGVKYPVSERELIADALSV